MVTGDHLRTAISVALQCSILPAKRPICLIDGADSSGSSEPGLLISLLNADGTVEEGAAQAAVLPRVLLGELEVAVTGKGFSRMLGSTEPGLMQVGRGGLLASTWRAAAQPGRLTQSSVPAATRC
jgi:magnesium-transporting ATPase (P-type)